MGSFSKFHVRQSLAPGPSGVRGFTLLELVVVVSIIGILLAVAANRLLPYIDEAERISVIRVEGQLRSSLVMEAAKRIVRGRSASIAALEDGNPMNLLLEPPKNYLGVWHDNNIQEVPVRHWYFAQPSQRLVYRPGLPFGLDFRGDPPANPTFVVRVEYDDLDRNGTFDATRDELFGVRLVRVSGEQWLAGVAWN